MNGVIADTVTLNTWRSLLSTLGYKSLICFNGVLWALVKASAPLAVHLSLVHTLSLLCFSLYFLFSLSPCPPIPLNLTCTVSLNYSLSARRTVSKEQAQCRVSGLNVKVFPYQVCIHSHNELRSLSCFSVRRVQTRPLFSTSSDASMFFCSCPSGTKAGEQPSHWAQMALLGRAMQARGKSHVFKWTLWEYNTFDKLFLDSLQISHNSYKKTTTIFSNCDMNMYFVHGTMVIRFLYYGIYWTYGIIVLPSDTGYCHSTQCFIT